MPASAANAIEAGEGQKPRNGEKDPKTEPPKSERTGQAEADRPPPTALRGRRAHAGRSPNRARLCRGHGGARREAGPARIRMITSGASPIRSLLRGSRRRKSPQTDEDHAAPCSATSMLSLNARGRGRRRDAHHAACTMKRQIARRGEPVRFQANKGQRLSFRQGEGAGALRRRRRSLVGSRPC